jgi:ABC-type phosphate transport system permease subunit
MSKINITAKLLDTADESSRTAILAAISLGIVASVTTPLGIGIGSVMATVIIYGGCQRVWRKISDPQTTLVERIIKSKAQCATTEICRYELQARIQTNLEEMDKKNFADKAKYE